MKTLKDLLTRYKNIKAPERALQQAFAKAVYEVLEIEIDPKQVKIKNKVATLQLPAVVKSEIRLHQQDILNRVCDEVADEYALKAIF